MVVGKTSHTSITSKNGKTTDYRLLTFVDTQGVIQQLLLTDREFAASVGRATKNKEHLAPTGFLDSFLAFFLRLF